MVVNGETITAKARVVERLQPHNPCKASDMDSKKDLSLAPDQSPSPYPVTTSTLINPSNTKVHLRRNMGGKMRRNRKVKANPESSKYSTLSPLFTLLSTRANSGHSASSKSYLLST